MEFLNGKILPYKGNIGIIIFHIGGSKALAVLVLIENKRPKSQF